MTIFPKKSYEMSLAWIVVTNLGREERHLRTGKAFTQLEAIFRHQTPVLWKLNIRTASPAMKLAISRLGAIRTWSWWLRPQAWRWWLTSRHRGTSHKCEVKKRSWPQSPPNTWSHHPWLSVISMDSGSQIIRNPDSGLSGTRILKEAIVWWWSKILATDSLATSSKFSRNTHWLESAQAPQTLIGFLTSTVQWSQCSLHLLPHDKIGICTCCKNPTRSDKKLTQKRSNLKSKHEHIFNHFNTVNSMRAMLCVWQWTDCLRK